MDCLGRRKGTPNATYCVWDPKSLVIIPVIVSLILSAGLFAGPRPGDRRKPELCIRAAPSPAIGPNASYAM